MRISDFMVWVELGAATADSVRHAAGLAVRFRARLTGVAARHVPGLVPVREVPEVERIHEASDFAVLDADGHGRPSRGGSVNAT